VATASAPRSAASSEAASRERAFAAAALFRLREYVITFASPARLGGCARGAAAGIAKLASRFASRDASAGRDDIAKGNEARASAEGEPRRIGRWRTLASDEAVERARERPSGARACAAASASLAIPPRTFFLSPPTTRSDEAVSCHCSPQRIDFAHYSGGEVRLIGNAIGFQGRPPVSKPPRSRSGASIEADRFPHVRRMLPSQKAQLGGKRGL
jgi:hypothetical protein